MEVRLTWTEQALAAQVGAWRQIASVRDERPDRHGADEADGWSLHVEGAAGELAAAKLLGIYWPPSVNTFKSGGDVGEYQVRTRLQQHYDLLVRPSDPDAIYILVVGRVPVFSVIGWTTAAEARQDRFWKTYGGRAGAWFVPQQELHALDLLPR